MTPSWWWKMSSAISRAVFRRATRRLTGDERSHRADHRDGAGAVRGVRADRVHQRPDRTILRQFALTIAISTVISAFNSLTLSPALAAVLLKDHDAPKDLLSRGMEKCSAGFSVGSTTFSSAARQKYGSGVGSMLAQERRRLLVYGGCLLATAWSLRHGADRLRAAAGQAISGRFAQLPDGSSLDRTEAVIRACRTSG